MAALTTLDIEYRRINDFVAACTALTNVTGAFLYGIDSNGASVKIAVSAIAGGDYDAQIETLTNKCNNNATLIQSLQTALGGKAAAQHTHNITDVNGLSAALDNKAAASHTHVMSDVDGLSAALDGKQNTLTFDTTPTAGSNRPVTSKGIKVALDGKADAQHTHAISSVNGLQTVLDGTEQRLLALEDGGGGGTVDALKQRDLSAYAGTDGEIAQHSGTTTAELHDGWTYKCTVGETVKTIAAGTDCIRFTQGGRSFVSDGSTEEYNVDCLFAVIEVDGVAYTLFEGSAVGSYVINHNCPKAEVPNPSRYAWHDGATLENVTAVNGISYTLSNGVTLVGASWGGDTTPALILYDEASGERYHGCYSSNFVGNRSLYLVSATTDSNGKLVPSEPLGTAFGGEKTVFTATDGIVIRAHSWTQHGTQPPTSVASGDNFLTITNNELGASIDIAYNSSNQHLELKGKNSAVVSYVDMGVFIKDGMLENVEYYTTAEQGVSVETPYMKFTFNTDSGKSVIRISLHDLVNLYDGANINLTSAFVKAATYSAPAIGDSMDVAIGKLLKGHEDNAAAIATKQNALTFDSTPTANSNNPVTSGGIKAAIDAAVGSVPDALKQVDLTTYQGTDGEIVQHTGVTTAQYTNGWNYKFTQGGTLPSNEFCIKLQGAITQYQQDVDIAQIIGDDRIFFNSNEEVTYYADDNAKLYIGSKTAPAIGDSILGNNYNEAIWSVEEVVKATQPFKVRYNNGNLLTQTKTYTWTWYKNRSGVKMDCLTSWNDAAVMNHPITVDYAWFVEHNGKLYKITLADGAWLGSTDDVDNGGWQQWDSQPQTDISGKQDAISGGASSITSTNLTASKALISDANGKVAASTVTATELGYVSGVTSAIQTQFSGKVDKVTGKGLSTNDYTDTEKDKLAGIAAGATAVTVDAELSASSTNAIRNSAVDAGIKNAQRVFYAVTETAGATAVKEFTIPNFPTETINGVKTPLKGTILIAQCTNADARSAQLKFKVNDGGEFPIRFNNAEWTSTSTSGTVFGSLNQNYVYAFDGTCWCWVSHGYENNTVYSAGAGLKLSSNRFSLNVPRVAKSCDSLPGANTAIIEEYTNGNNYNLPTNAWYHILTMQGGDSQSLYATQLALGMTTPAAYYRIYYSGVWESWKRLDNPTMDSTPTAGNTSNVVSSAGIKTYVDTQVATKSNVVIRQWVTE